ncbi:MAG: signal recognition particle-docking protein FtsY [Holosporales bacterium]
MSKEQPQQKQGWLTRLKEGLKRSSSKLSEGISGIFTKRRLDQDALDELQDLLIISDMGVAAATRLTADLAKTRFNQEVTDHEVRETLAAWIAEALRPLAHPLDIKGHKPHVIMMVGVNGSGKTTALGKLAHLYQSQGLRVRIAACDTFRAAAVEQLETWAKRSAATFSKGDLNADAAGLAFEAYQQALAHQEDVLLIDTAGRLQNKANLMAELEKMTRVLKKLNPEAPHSVLLVLDATTGQNALSQVEVFKETAGVTGLVITKLDGTAKGGILVAIAERHALPIHAVGVGEGLEDLQPFHADTFARSLLGLETS